MQRAIPPDLSHARLPAREDSRQREAIGDLHLAADHFAGACEEFRAALLATPADAAGERCRILLRLAEAENSRGESDAALRALAEAHVAARGLDDQ